MDVNIVPPLPEPARPPLIVGVAIRDPEGGVWSMRKPSRHGHLIHAIYESTGVPGGQVASGDWEQGFMSEQGNFLTRTEALWLAVNNGQIDSDNLKPGQVELFSEDLW